MFDEILVLESGARTATTQSKDFLNQSRGILLLVNVTSVAATGSITGIDIMCRFDDTNYSKVYTLTLTAPITATGHYYLLLYPSASLNSTNMAGTPIVGVLPSRFAISVTHGNGVSLIYSVRGHVLH